MPEFDVGHVELQDFLEWVDQPPPQQPRDTHALTFTLYETPTEELRYEGLMFFRPGNPTSPLFRQQPGLSGVGRALLTVPACQKILGPSEEIPFRGLWVQVEVRFRPPQTFAALFILPSEFVPHPGDAVREVEFDHVDVTSGGPWGVHLHMDPGWGMEFRKTTVLYDRP